MFTDEKLGKRIRKFYPENLEVTSWETVEREFKKLLEEPIDSKEALMVFMEKFSEFYSIIAQISTEKYIKMTCYSDKPENHEDYNKFFSEIQAPSSKYEFLINKRFYESPYRKELGKEYDHMNKLISRKIESFCE
ncbi:MAG TPA: M3 family oligoendopeptidase, partial [Petrotogaceae bacterium]|nr:M3 family oligoendopeptidase [Petrotogaceae bacterium]